MDARKRRTFLTLGAIAAGYVGLRTLPDLLPERLVFQPMASPPGFRMLGAGQVSTGFDPFFGLDAAYDTDAPARREAATRRVAGDICGALYGDLPSGGGRVPAASFSDYYCPYCRVQTRQLAGMTDEISVAWHELPLLGEGSKIAARAALAAKRQGAYVGFHEALMSTRLLASPPYVARLAGELGIDAGRLMADMDSPEIARELEDSAALARLFGFVGTPALVIGRTVIQGQIDARTIRRIIAQEREAGWDSVCRA